MHLGARPLMGPDGLRCPLGRDTFVQQVEWTEDGWLRLVGGGHHPRVAVAVAGPRSVTVPADPAPAVDETLLQGPEWMSLRGPADGTWVDRDGRPGWVRLRGRESLTSLFEQSLLDRRLPGRHAVVEVTVDAEPTHFTQSAGLVDYYNTTGYHYLAAAAATVR